MSAILLHEESEIEDIIYYRSGDVKVGNRNPGSHWLECGAFDADDKLDVVVLRFEESGIICYPDRADVDCFPLVFPPIDIRNTFASTVGLLIDVATSIQLGCTPIGESDPGHNVFWQIQLFDRESASIEITNAGMEIGKYDIDLRIQLDTKKLLFGLAIAKFIEWGVLEDFLRELDRA